MALPFPAGAKINPGMRHAGAVTPHRTADLGFARLDLDRARRTGTPEVVYAAGKTPAQTVACLAALLDGGSAPAWATRVGRRDRRGGARRAGPTPSSTPRPGAPSSASSRPGRAGRGAHRRHVGRPGRRRGRRDPGAQRGGLPRVDDVGVAGVHRVLAVAPTGRRRRGRRRRGHGRRAAERRRRADRPAGGGRPTSVGYGAAFEGSPPC
jgi:hypothetical protein